MTDKQIIVDGVNVVECVYREEEKCILKDDECCFFSNCDHKNWQRKEQECEKLKNWVKNMMFDTDRNDWFEHFVECFEDWKKDLFKQLDQLKARNEELKRLIAKQKNAKIQLSKLKDKQYKEFCDMKQALTEIKEIAENCYDPTDKENDGFWTILQKIKECEM